MAPFGLFCGLTLGGFQHTENRELGDHEKIFAEFNKKGFGLGARLERAPIPIGLLLDTAMHFLNLLLKYKK